LIRIEALEMGVTNLWQILQPIARPLNMNELQNKTIAIDLSIWICENSTIQYGTNPCLKPYLRTLFFRCKSLIELGCTLVFVSEGEVIQLKQKTMEKRINSRFGFLKKPGSNETSAPSGELSDLKSKTKTIKRGHFATVVNEVSHRRIYYA
jgi:hypothetical protein